MSQSKLETAPLVASVDIDSTGDGAKPGTLALAGIAGVLASACCIGPLLLASIGLGSIAAGVAATFEPLRPVFVVVALAALGIAGWRIYHRPARACEPDAVCAAPRADRVYKPAFWVVAVIVLALLAFPYYVTLFL